MALEDLSDEDQEEDWREILDDFSCLAHDAEFDELESMAHDPRVRCILFSEEGRRVLEKLLIEHAICKDWLAKVGLLIVLGEG